MTLIGSCLILKHVFIVIRNVSEHLKSELVVSPNFFLGYYEIGCRGHRLKVANRVCKYDHLEKKTECHPTKMIVVCVDQGYHQNAYAV